MIHSPGIPKPGSRAPRRILAIDPISPGFGFAVLEWPDRLIDWGVVHVPTDKHRGCLRKIGQLIGQYSPETVVTEDVTGPGSRRGTRIRGLVAGIQALAKERSVACRRISRGQVRRAFSESDALTKHQIATVIAGRFLELRPRLPRPRKCYESADQRMAIFDAVALGLTTLRSRR